MMQFEKAVADSLYEKLGQVPKRKELAKAVINLSTRSDTQTLKLVDQQIEVLWNKTKSVWEDFRRACPYCSIWGSSDTQIVVPDKDSPKVFLSGGGACLPNIDKVFKRSWVSGEERYEVHRIPKPNNLKMDQKEIPYIRLAAACGLCTPIPELGDSRMLYESMTDNGNRMFPVYNG
jgi:hypothetical protein